MSTNNRTLADVQPGGRVRLGNVRDRVMGECEQWFDTSDVDMEAATDSIIAAAQPSPGGQDAVASLVSRWRDAANSFDEEQARQTGYEIDWTPGAMATAFNQAADELEAALAARQPVGQEPVAVVTSGDRFTYGKLNRDLPDGTQLYATPPAQAVDLDAMRALLQRRIEQWRSHLPADPGAPGTREIETKGERDYNNDVRIYREGIAVMEEVLSKIGGQAVGK